MKKNNPNAQSFFATDPHGRVFLGVISHRPTRTSHNGCSKFLLRRSAADLLPEDVCRRAGKESLAQTVNGAVFEMNRDKFQQFAKNDLKYVNGYVNEKIVLKAWERYDAGKKETHPVNPQNNLKP